MSKRNSQSGDKTGWQNVRQMIGLDADEPFIGGMIFVLILVIFALLGLIFLQDRQGLRDWVMLFILLLMFISGGLLFIWFIRRGEQRVQHEIKLAEWYAQHEREMETQRFQETALQTYLDRMTNLLLDHGLRRSQPGDEVRDIARARTLTTLRGMDGAHKGILIRFLHESELITNEGIVDLNRANLRGANLHKAQLVGVDLSGADLSGSDLSEANLSGGNLSNAMVIVANLNEANLSSARLIGASLIEAVMNGANFNATDLTQADLHGANIENAGLVQANLTEAKLNGAILMDADLSEATLHKTDLSRTNLNRTNLSKAQLVEANLNWADLSWANLAEANFRQADLHGANLDGAEVVGSNLKEAKSLKGVKMPDGKEHE